MFFMVTDMRELLKYMKKINELGHLERGTGKHQSNIVYSVNGLTPCIAAGCEVKYWIYIIERKPNEKTNNSNC